MRSTQPTTVPATPHCPSCEAPLTSDAISCPECQFSAEQCMAKFPYEAPILTRVLDLEKRLKDTHRSQIDRAINRLERTCPQVRFYVCVTRLPRGANAREFGYWLFNTGKPVEGESEEQRLFGMLLVIDRSHRSASLTAGYELEAYYGDTELRALLDDASHELRTGRYHEAIQKIVSHFQDDLRAIGKGLRKASQEPRRRPRSAKATTEHPVDEPFTSAVALAHDRI